MNDTGAVFSPCRTYRYRLWRKWRRDGFGGERLIGFLMLNPSTADEAKNDPTVERCQRRAAAMGYDGLVVANIFALRSTDPAALTVVDDPIGPDNDKAILEMASECDKIVCAWGTHGRYLNRGIQVRDMIAKWHPRKLNHLGLSKDGHPKHPLYISYKVEPEPWIV